MNYFEALEKQINSLMPSVLVRAAITDKEQVVLSLVKDDQLKEKGIDATGDIIGTYSLFTANNDSRKVFGEPYDLFDTGAFQKSFDLIIDNEGVYIKADGKTGKDEDIIQKYGEEIIGFTDESVQKYIDLIKANLPEILAKVFTRLQQPI